MIIGITGTMGAGKGTIVEILKERGFKHYSVREFLIEEIEKRRMPVNRDSMVEVANDLREKNSPSYIIEQLYERAKENKGDSVIESLRVVGEIEKLRTRKNFYLFSVDADAFLRYERISRRKSESDNVSYGEFLSQESREMNSDDSTKQNLRKCIDMADFKFENNGDIEDLRKDIFETLVEIEERNYKSFEENETEDFSEEEYSRPSWDEYFMEIVHAVSKRATCDRGRTGCVIVKNKQILATGYVGSAVGQPHCDDVGHLIEETIHADGIKREHCIRTIHAEQNAVCQAAKKGVSIYGATIYCKLEPCPVCAKILVNSGIKKVICEKRYHAAQESRKIFEMAGVEVVAIKEEVDEY